jgi:gamma-glutamyltranspeptidase
VKPFTDRDAARERWDRCFDPERATGPDELRRGEDGPACGEDERASLLDRDADGCTAGVVFGAGADDCRLAGTTAFAVADANGDLVAVTQTLGTWGGNFYVSPGLGFLYNDKLGSYRTDPDAYGARLPYARHGTSIAPTLVFEGTGNDQRPKLAVGAAGNAWITSAVYQVVAAMVDRGSGPQEALELPRFLVGAQSDGHALVQIEDAFAPDVLHRLAAMGHRLQRISLRGELRMGYGAAVLIEDGRVRAGADPRRSGAAAAVSQDE